jgi:hypothetical protein
VWRTPSAAHPQRVSARSPRQLDPGGARPRAWIAVLVEDRSPGLVLAAVRAEPPADDAARFADVHAPIDARVHLAEQQQPVAAGDCEIARAVERSPVKDRSDLAIACIEVIPRQPRRGDDARLEHARENPEPVTTPPFGPADEAVRKHVIAEPGVVL